MTRLGKSVKIMPHLKFNVALDRAFIKKGTHSIPKVTTMVGAFVLNLEVLHYSMQWT
jgi:hypothetical protein